MSFIWKEGGGLKKPPLFAILILDIVKEGMA